ncbi:MFS transporter [Xanthomonas campestris]|uniref:MFS transporter n=2 Tax=Xanthomonas campestris TaxID=339 RepID=UPI002B1FD6C6|nr:MFS transporter [Xanthomonas campestris]
MKVQSIPGVSARRMVTLIGAVALVGSNGLLLGPILGEVSASLHTSPEVLARVISTYGAGTAISALVLAPTIDKIGAKKALIAGFAALVVAMLASAAAATPLLLALAQFLAGLGAGVVLPSAYMLATHLGPPEEASSSLGRVLIGWSLALVVLVPSSAFIAENLHWRAAYLGLFTLGIFVIAGLYDLPAIAPVHQENKAHQTRWDTLSDPAVLKVLSICFIFTSSFYGVYAFVAKYAQVNLHMSTSKSSAVVLSFGLGFAAATLAGKWGARVGPFTMLPLALVVNAVLYVAMIPATHHLSALILVSGSWGFVNHLTLNCVVVLLSKISPRQAGAVLGFNSATTYLGVALGTAAASHIYPTAGFATLVEIAATLHLVAAAICLFRNRQHAPEVE